MSELILTFPRRAGKTRLKELVSDMAESEGISEAEAARRLLRAHSEPLRNPPGQGADADDDLHDQDPDRR